MNQTRVLLVLLPFLSLLFPFPFLALMSVCIVVGNLIEHSHAGLCNPNVLLPQWTWERIVVFSLFILTLAVSNYHLPLESIPVLILTCMF